MEKTDRTKRYQIVKFSDNDRMRIKSMLREN